MERIYHIFTLMLFVFGFNCFSQSNMFLGTLTIENTLNFNQTIGDVVQEAGGDDASKGFIIYEGNILSYTTVNCEANIYRYGVYAYVIGLPQGVTLEARLNNRGIGIPSSMITDLSGAVIPRDAYSRPGGNDGFHALPNDGSQANLLYEFVGCRQDMSLDIRIKASSATYIPALSTNNIEIIYTVRGKRIQ